MKSLVAIFAALLALVGPAAAQDPSGEPGSEPPSQDQPQSEPSSEPAAEPEPSSEPAAEPAQQQPAQTAHSSIIGASGCPLVESNIGDPGAKPYQLIIIDPRGCFQQLIYRVVGSVPPSITRPL